MDAFTFHENLVTEYERYFRSLGKIRVEDIPVTKAHMHD